MKAKGLSQNVYTTDDEIEYINGIGRWGPYPRDKKRLLANYVSGLHKRVWDDNMEPFLIFDHASTLLSKMTGGG